MAETEDLQQFPEGLIRWSGYRHGGVRKPFQRNTGRPTGDQFETPVVLRLRSWVEGLVAGNDVPRAIFLVGGPGNGKTDAVEGCIEALDRELNARGALYEAFATQYHSHRDELPPRKTVVDLSSIGVILPSHLQVSVSLVQDATEGDQSIGASAEQLLLDDIAGHVDAESAGIYICCVNRGILAHAASIAEESGDYFISADLLSKITMSVTSGPTAPSCWPLEGYSHIGVWPMDVESLVAPSDTGFEQSVAYKIFESALEEKRWNEPCELGTRCPFCQNRRLLTRKGVLESLVQLLYYYEVSSGKRWTFRDLFSLVPYLIVGDYSELEIRGKRLSPCDWAAEQYRIAREGPANSVERDRAPFLLMSRLFHHRLFPRWPGFDRGEHRSAKRELFKEKHSDEGLLAARGYFRFASKAQEIISRASGDIPDRIRDSLGPALEPALSPSERVLFSKDGQDYAVADVENRLSLSVRNGLELVGTQIETLERDILQTLVLADEALVEDKFPRNRTRQARLLQSTIRQFAARLVKRSLGVRRAVCRDVDHFERYVSAARQTAAQNDVRKELRNLLHDSNNKFRAGLATTFGQPIAERSRDVALLLPKMVAVQPVLAEDSDKRPAENLPYFRIEGHYVALTYELFRVLEEVSDGLHEASLPSEIYSLLDRVKSLVAGQVVRDEQILNDEPHIVLGSSLDTIEYVGGQFHFSRGGRQ
ncbi:hypothetical protein AAFN88_07675 [Pelagibius sp. CAU 1746]|uniref:hypothetical protein n=1 Tax=Pelagibius sp. CAU 1746 TaxID=3140370 RepID=UPI00325BE4E0